MAGTRNAQCTVALERPRTLDSGWRSGPATVIDFGSEVELAMPNLEDLPLLVWTVDEELQISFCGGRLKERLDADPCERLEEALSRLLGDVGQGDHALREAHRRALKGKRSSCRIFLVGRALQVFVEPGPIDDAGIACIGIAVLGDEQIGREAELRRHIAELKHLVMRQEEEIAASQEQLLVSEHLAATGMLASGLGHDIGNTLLPMRLRVDALEQLDLGERAGRDLNAIRQSMEYLRRLSNSLRQLVRDSDDVDSAGHALEIAQWWENVGPLLVKAVPNGVQVEQAIANSLPRAAIAEHQLTQAMLNVISNAGEAAGEGGRIRISAEQSEDGSAVRIRVADDGPGMSREVASRLMQPFYTSKTRRFSTGLGLFVVKGIVKRAGGTIEIDTAPGRGTTVTLHIPVATNSTRPPVAGHKPQAIITIRDSRLSAFASALLFASGYEVKHNAADDSSGQAIIVVDIEESTFAWASARRAIDTTGAEDVQIIALGKDPSGRWGGIGAVIVDPAVGAVALRTALRHALEKFHGHRSHTKDHQSAGR